MSGIKWTGFYSPSMDASCGHSIWNTPDGDRVKVTCTSSEGHSLEEMNTAYKWGDLVAVGEVVNQIVPNPLLALEMDGIESRYSRDMEDCYCDNDY